MAPQSMGRLMPWLMLKLMLLALTTAAANDSTSCQAIVWASDDGKWSVGGTGQVSCACNGSNANLENLKLHLSGSILTTEIVNNTVRYTEPSATETVQNEYECWLNNFPETSVMVTVYPVLNVTDFYCRFDVRDKLNCSFSRADGEEFHERTRYQLGVASGGKSQCTAEQDNAARMHCILDMPGYAYEMPNQTFTLNQTFTGGGGTQTQQIVLSFDSMYVPKWPTTKPNRTTVTDNQTCLAWERAKDLLERNLEWVVELRPRLPQIPPLNLTLPGGEKTDQMSLTFCFPHPPQGFQVFDVRLKCHIKGNNTIWSEYYPEFDITTNATVPARPPQFMPNSFSFDEDSKELTVLWFPLDEIDHNGPNLTYDVYRNGNEKASHTFGRSATFTNWDISKPANVTVRSRNSEGASVDSRWMWVPAINEVAKRRATHLKNRPHFNGSTTFTWDKPEDNDLLLGYTIYWCNSSNQNGQFCLDGGSTNNISLDNGDRQEYKFNISTAQLDIALEPNYSDHVSGGMSVLLNVNNEYFEEFTLRKARILEGIGALLVLGLVIMTVKKLRKMNDVEVDLGFLIVPPTENSNSDMPKSEPPPSPRLGVPRITNGYYGKYDPQRRESIELTPYTEEQSEREPEETMVVAETEPVSSSYSCMDPIGNPIGRNGDIRPPSPPINRNSNGYVMSPPPRLIPNNEGYINPPLPRLNPNNNPNSNGYVLAPPPRLIPNNEGYINPPSPRSNPNRNPNNNGYVMAPPPRLIPNNNGYVDPPPPRLIPNSDGYINPPPPRG